MSSFLAAVVEKQGDRTNAEFATAIGISPSIWSRVRNGRRPIGRQVMMRILAVYPALSGYLAEDARAISERQRRDVA